VKCISDEMLVVVCHADYRVELVLLLRTPLFRCLLVELCDVVFLECCSL